MRGLALTALAGLGMGVIEAVLTPVALISPYRALAPYFIALLTVAVLSFFSHASLKER
jgi:branched-chain amino acid transport system permease protein